jgi:hypothetical protein
VTVGADDYDSPWKEALEQYLAECLELLFPEVYAGIDWDRGYESLDQELRQVLADAEQGPRVVDKLVRVWRRAGAESWVLVHLEVQAQPVRDFAERMFVYYYRLFDRYRRPITSLAILADERPRWRPRDFDRAQWGCRVRFEFPVAKLLDLRPRVAELGASRNPFVAVLLAHLGAQETRGDNPARYAAKFAALRRLYDLGYNQAEILRLYRVIDWLMRLPRELEAELLREMERFEEVRRMPYVTSAERIGIEKGLQQGLQQGLEQGIQRGREEGLQQGLRAGLELALRLKFGAAAEGILPEVRELADLAVIEAIYARLESARTIDDVRRLYR